MIFNKINHTKDNSHEAIKQVTYLYFLEAQEGFSSCASRKYKWRKKEMRGISWENFSLF